MSIRYLSNLALLLIAAFIVVITQAWAVGTVQWLAFAAGIAFAAIGAVMQLRRGLVHRLFNATTGVLGVLMIIETLLTSGSTLVWLSFAGACAVAATAVAGLTLHEVKTERVVHSLAPAPERERVYS
jgi:hypothetical protein